MELKLDQALIKGVEAHKAGKLEEADRYYTAILKVQPKHPDANHNIGVLAVGINKIEQALPFFKTALDSNPIIAQYWISYIDALIKLNRKNDANTVLNQAKSRGLKGDGFEQIEKKLTQLEKDKRDQNEKKIFEIAISLRERGEFDQAIDLLNKGTRKFPKDPNLLALLSHCYILNENLEKADIYLNRAKNISPKMASVGWNETRLLLKKQKVSEALTIAKKTHKLFPKDVEGMAVVGSCLRASGEFKESLIFLNKAIELDNQYAEAFIIRGLIYLSQKNKPKALADLEKGFHLKPHFKQIWDLLISLKIDSKDYHSAIMILINMIEIDPNHKKSFELLAICNQRADDTALVIKSFKKILEVRPNDAATRIKLGLAFQRKGMTEKAINEFKEVLSIKPDFTAAHLNIGNALKDQGKLEEAIEAYKKAISIKPNYAEAYINMGVILKKQSKLEKAVEAFKKAISIKPDYAEAYINMGIIFKKQSKLEKAVEAFKKAISIKPDYAVTFSNMGNALNAQGKLKESIEAFKKAISIRPDYAEPYWNLYGTSGNIGEAKKWIEQCLKADPNHVRAKLTLSALKFYEGNKSEFRAIVKSKLMDHPYMRSFTWTFSLPKLPQLYFNRWALFDQMAKLSDKNRPFYEFGVWRGEAFKYLLKTFKKGYGFDTFEGLPEDWHNEKAGAYSSDGNIPTIKGGEFIIGKFEDTLPVFFAEKRPRASIINFDADLYSSTICALNFSKPVIDEHTILIFDEFIINETWEQDEYRALEEFCLENNYTYNVLAISFFTKQVAVKILGI